MDHNCIDVLELSTIETQYDTYLHISNIMEFVSLMNEPKIDAMEKNEEMDKINFKYSEECRNTWKDDTCSSSKEKYLVCYESSQQRSNFQQKIRNSDCIVLQRASTNQIEYCMSCGLLPKVLDGACNSQRKDQTNEMHQESYHKQFKKDICIKLKLPKKRQKIGYRSRIMLKKLSKKVLKKGRLCEFSSVLGRMNICLVHGQKGLHNNRESHVKQMEQNQYLQHNIGKDIIGQEESNKFPIMFNKLMNKENIILQKRNKKKWLKVISCNGLSKRSRQLLKLVNRRTVTVSLRNLNKKDIHALCKKIGCSKSERKNQCLLTIPNAITNRQSEQLMNGKHTNKTKAKNPSNIHHNGQAMVLFTCGGCCMNRVLLNAVDAHTQIQLHLKIHSAMQFVLSKSVHPDYENITCVQAISKNTGNNIYNKTHNDDDIEIIDEVIVNVSSRPLLSDSNYILNSSLDEVPQLGLPTTSMFTQVCSESDISHMRDVTQNFSLNQQCFAQDQQIQSCSYGNEDHVLVAPLSDTSFLPNSFHGSLEHQQTKINYTDSPGLYTHNYNNFNRYTDISTIYPTYCQSGYVQTAEHEQLYTSAGASYMPNTSLLHTSLQHNISCESPVSLGESGYMENYSNNNYVQVDDGVQIECELITLD